MIIQIAIKGDNGNMIFAIENHYGVRYLKDLNAIPIELECEICDEIANSTLDICDLLVNKNIVEVVKPKYGE